MLDLLYEQVVLKKEHILSKLTDMITEDIDPSKFWVDYKFDENIDDVVFAAGDGSINSKKYLSYNLFAVSSESLIFNGELLSLKSCDIDIIPQHKHVKDRLRNYMALYEIKTAIKTLKTHDIDYYMLDGSLLGNLIRPYVLDKSLNENLKNLIITQYVPKLKNNLASFNLNNNKKIDFIDIDSKAFFDDIGDNLSSNDDNQYDPIIYLENIEHLILIRYLLGLKEKIVGISKTSSSREYFDAINTDISIFSIFSKKEGYSKPKYVDISETTKREFPVEDEFFRDINFTIFYARLEDGYNMLKFELPYKATEEEVIQLLKKIKKYSIEGYPYLLKKAHHDVVITNKNMDRLEKNLGIIEQSGREML